MICLVWREDIYGNRDLVKDHLTQKQAELLVDEMTSRGHHQSYYLLRYNPKERKKVIQQHNIRE